jgi:hypothetical protein
MNRDEFWELIATGQAEKAPGKRVRAALKKLSSGELESYQQHFDELFDEAYRVDLWGAAYTLEGGCSDDGFTYFRYALISLGRKVFESALKNPDSLANIEIREDESFGYIAHEVYEERTGKSLPVGRARLAQPQGESWDFDDADEVRRRMPKIAARAGIS